MNEAFAISDQIPSLEMKGRVYASCVRNSMTYGTENRPLLADVRLKFERAEMHMIGWMCGVSMKDRRTSEELRKLVGLEPITTVIRSGRLRCCCCCLPSETYGRNGATPIFRSFFHRTASSTTGGWSRWNI